MQEIQNFWALVGSDTSYMANYLVLGGEGFIGKALVNFLISEGNSVHSLDFRSDSKQDLRVIKINNLPDFDATFFLAWNVGGSKFLNQTSTWHSQFTDNIALINNVFPQLITASKPFLFVSSQLAGIDNSPYSLTKKLAEEYCATIATSVVARQWNVYGSIENFDDKSHVISDFIIQALRTGEIHLLTDGSEQRKFVHLNDTCRAYLQMIKEQKDRIYDVSSAHYITILEVAELIAKITGAKLFPSQISGYTPFSTECATYPGWEPTISLEDGIRNLITEYSKSVY